MYTSIKTYTLPKDIVHRIGSRNFTLAEINATELQNYTLSKTTNLSKTSRGNFKTSYRYYRFNNIYIYRLHTSRLLIDIYQCKQITTTIRTRCGDVFNEINERFIRLANAYILSTET